MQSGRGIALRFVLGRGEVVRGESFEVGGRRLTPIARVRKLGSAGGRFELHAVDPVGIVEEVGGSRRLIAIGGGWGRRAGMLALISMPVVAYVVARSIARAARARAAHRSRLALERRSPGC